MIQLQSYNKILSRSGNSNVLEKSTDFETINTGHYGADSYLWRSLYASAIFRIKSGVKRFGSSAPVSPLGCCC